VRSTTDRVRLVYTHQQLMRQSATKDAHKGAGYNHWPNATNATPTTVAVTIAAINVATNTKAILACLGQIIECVDVLDHDAPILELDSPTFF
jgi:hypothetical protein